MKIAVENGFIQIVSLNFQAKKKMNASELLNELHFQRKLKLININKTGSLSILTRHTD
jgi:methionyl-tRNA formyltransferase